MKILVTGSQGQLGRTFQSIQDHNPDMQMVFTHSGILDLSNQEEVENFVTDNGIQAIVNCSAYTNVDEAESSIVKPSRKNVFQSGMLSRITNKYGIPLVLFSTDYVYDRHAQNTPFGENVIPAKPAGKYAYSKWTADKLLNRKPNKNYIIRTSWLYSKYGHNFFNTVMKWDNTRTYTVVDDQVGTPTLAEDLAQTVISLLKKDQLDPQYGLYNYSNEGVASWYDFAQTISHLACKNLIIKPVPSKDYPQKAPRPHYSVLDKTKIKKHLDITIPHWMVSLHNLIYS